MAGLTIDIFQIQSRQGGSTKPMMALLTMDHEALDRLLGDLLEEFDKGDKIRVFEKLDLLWARLAMHIRAEHLHLFPAILNALGEDSNFSPINAPSWDQAQEAVARLCEDHDFFMAELAKAVNAARELLTPEGRPSTDQLREIKRRVLAVSCRLLEHNRLEEEQVYLWAETLLSATECARLLARMKHEIENLPPRFSISSGNT
jgi:hemerythrin superfamily protein